MTATAATMKHAISIQRETKNAPILISNETMGISIRAGTTISIDGDDFTFDQDTELQTGELKPGTDYAIVLFEEGDWSITPTLARLFTTVPADGRDVPLNAIGGFHFAPGGNAKGIEGGDSTPAINPCSIWDMGFRPACPDPRGMALVSTEAGPAFWADIYLLGTNHHEDGTSRHGATIADGYSRPQSVNGTGRSAKLDYLTAVEICTHHGKRLMTAVEFFAAAYGVKERSSIDDEPDTCGLDAKRTSRFGLMQATGNMWVWGTDGHPDDPRPSFFGGSWIYGSDAGSRFAGLDYWPEYSNEFIGVRAASDHLNLA